MKLKWLRITLTLLLACGANSFAKKPDWTGGGGSVIGFALVELTPSLKDGRSIPTDFTFEYAVPASPQSKWFDGGTIIVIPAKAAAKFNNIPKTSFVAFNRVSSTHVGGAFSMTSTVKITEPGLYMICYGPSSGMLVFDESDGAYKISGRSKTGSMRWIDQDAGDITFIDLSLIPSLKSRDAFVRLRLLRNSDAILKDHSIFKIEPFALEPTALKRVNLMHANW